MNLYLCILHTDEFFTHLVPLAQVFGAEDERVDEAQQCHHVVHIICALQFTYDHAEAVLLHLYSLQEKIMLTI